MAYVNRDFNTKRELIEAVKNGEEIVTISQGFFPAPQSGKIVIEGPQFPRPHKWYASAEIQDGRVIKVK